MIRFKQGIIGLFLAGALAYVGITVAQPVTPSPQAPQVVPPPPAKKKPTGARSSRHHWLAYQATRQPLFVHEPKAVPVSFVPAVILTPAQMSYWGNDTFGDCVSAEEAFAKDIYPVWYSKTGSPVLIPTATVETWRRQNGYLNGADLTSVMDSMARSGMAVGGTTYTDGPYTSVDYTNWATLTSAIYQGPVKIGVAAAQLQNTQGVGEQNGWIATGYRRDGNEDHCVSLCGYGTMAQLATAMGVTLPSGVNGSSQGLLLFTWDTIGIIDFASMNAITGEAWLRTPTTPQTPVTPTPTPTPGDFSWSLVNPPAGASVDGSGNFTWLVPASQPAGPVTISFTVTGASGSATGSFTINVGAASPITIAPIPPQTAAAGSTISVGLGQYVTTSTPHGPGH